MADLVKDELTLRIDNVFVDGDTRSITLKNPKDTIPTSQITELNALMQTNNILIGDKTNATFGKIKTVTKVEKYTTILDLSE